MLFTVYHNNPKKQWIFMEFSEKIPWVIPIVPCEMQQDMP